MYVEHQERKDRVKYQEPGDQVVSATSDAERHEQGDRADEGTTSPNAKGVHLVNAKGNGARPAMTTIIRKMVHRWPDPVGVSVSGPSVWTGSILGLAMVGSSESTSVGSLSRRTWQAMLAPASPPCGDRLRNL